MSAMFSYFKEQSGASAAEYGLILALVAGVIIAAFTLLGGNIGNVVNTVAGSIH